MRLVLNFLPLKKFGFLLQVLFEAAFEQTVSKAFTKTVRMCEVMCAAEGSCFAWLGSALFYQVGVSRRKNFPLVLGSPCLLARCGLERLRGHRVSGALCYGSTGGSSFPGICWFFFFPSTRIKQEFEREAKLKLAVEGTCKFFNREHLCCGFCARAAVLLCYPPRMLSMNPYHLAAFPFSPFHFPGK